MYLDWIGLDICGEIKYLVAPLLGMAAQNPIVRSRSAWETPTANKPTFKNLPYE